MVAYDPKFDPQNTDWEGMALAIVELDPQQRRVRGPSNDDGDDGIHRHAVTGAITVTEAKFKRENSRAPRADIDNLAEAVARAEELYDAPAVGQYVTTAEGLSKGAKSLLRQINAKGERVRVLLHDDLAALARQPQTGPELSFALGRALAKKARPTKRNSLGRAA